MLSRSSLSTSSAALQFWLFLVETGAVLTGVRARHLSVLAVILVLGGERGRRWTWEPGVCRSELWWDPGAQGTWTHGEGSAGSGSDPLGRQSQSRREGVPCPGAWPTVPPPCHLCSSTRLAQAGLGAGAASGGGPSSPGHLRAPIWVPTPGTNMGWQTRQGPTGPGLGGASPLLALPGVPLEQDGSI